jgi:hypothetical protein
VFHNLSVLYLNWWHFKYACEQETIDPNAKIEFKPNTEDDDDPHKRKPDITKAKELVGWKPKVPLHLPMMVSAPGSYARQVLFMPSNSDCYFV